MERVRLTNKVIAGMEKDVHNMNVPEKKDPGQKYQGTGDNPSGWAEDVAKKDWDGQKRDEMNVAVPGSGVNKNAAAIKSARKLEERAVKCIVAAQRMLPGASDDLIEAQAADLMHLPEIAIANTLIRQEDLAKSFTKEAADAAKEEEKEEEKKEEPKEEAKEAAKKEDEEVEEEKEASLEEVVASLKKQASTIQAALTKIQAGEMPEGFKKFIKKKKKDEKKEEVEAKKEEKEEMEPEAAKKPAKEDEMEAEAAKKEEKDEMEMEAAKKDEKEEEEEMEAEAGKKPAEDEVEMDEKEASAPSLLDTIFESVTGTSKKAGAKSLSGLVKKASNGEDNLSSLWDAPPDVSKNF